MKPIDVRTARTSLSRKGFESKQSDHEIHYFYFEGKKTTWRVKFSHGAKEMVQREIKANAQLFGLPASDFRGLLSCERDHAWLIARYRAANGIQQE